MSLRIVSRPAPAGGEGQAFGAGNGKPLDGYLERLVKLVPAESISAFPLLSSYAKAQGMWAEILVAWVLLLVSGVLRWHSTKGDAGNAQTKAIGVALISFVIWVGVMNGHFGLTQLLGVMGLTGIAEALSSGKEFLTVLALVVWTILVPVFYKGDPD